MLVLVHTNTFKKRYAAPLLSAAFLGFIIYLSILIVVPFILGFTSSGFWLKISEYREQPTILFNQPILVTVQGLNSGSVFSYSYSTDELFNQMNDDSIRFASVGITPIDSNTDGRIDSVSVNVTFPTLPAENVHQVQLAIGFHFQLSDRIRLVTQGVLLVDERSPLPCSTLHVLGQMNLETPYLMQDTIDYLVTEPVMNLVKLMSPPLSTVWEKLVSTYYARSIRPELSSIKSVWVPGGSSTDPLQINLHVKIPPIHIKYRPGIIEVLKYAWVQYAALFFLVALIVIPFYDFLIRNQVFRTSVVEPPLSRTSGKAVTLTSVSHAGVVTDMPQLYRPIPSFITRGF